jgi:hypothetical protein
MDLPFGPSIGRSRPTLVPGIGVPRQRPQPQARAGPSTRPQTPPLPHRSPQRPPPRRLHRSPSPTEEERELSPTPAPRRSTCLRRPPTRTGNIYGELRNPTDIEQEISHETAWECYTSGPSTPEERPRVHMPGEMTPPEPPQVDPLLPLLAQSNSKLSRKKLSLAKTT